MTIATEPHIPYQLIDCRPLNDLTYQINIAPIENKNAIVYDAGQYITIKCLDEDRPFSIANAPSADQRLEIHLQHLLNNDYLKDLFDTIENNSSLLIKGPYGHCSYQPENKQPIIFVAGGVGFAPIKALLEKCWQDNVDYPLHLFWGASQLQDLYWHQQILQWQTQYTNFSYTPVLVKPDAHWDGANGYVHETVMQHYPNMKNYKVFACGPVAMIKTLREHCLAADLMAKHFYSDVD